MIARLFALVLLAGCNPPTSDQIQRDQQEAILQEGSAMVGMPAVRNFRERKLLKDIIELRDQEGLVTYTYMVNEHTGELVFFCNSIGYAIPYATQFTNPQKIERRSGGVYTTMPQADPNGLFSPASAEGTWVMCKNPGGDEVSPVYMEPRIVTSPFPLLPVESDGKPAE